MKVKEGRAYLYARWCMEEQEGKVPKYVKLQAQSWIQIADEERDDAYVDEKAYVRI